MTDAGTDEPPWEIYRPEDVVEEGLQEVDNSEDLGEDSPAPGFDL